MLMLNILLFAAAGIVAESFVPLPSPPSEAEFRCANYSKKEWVVSIADGKLRVRPAPRQTIDPLPFNYKRQPDQAGDRHVVQVTGGWLVGFDAGEFGGGLWWFSAEGKRSVRLKPPANAPINPEDIFQAENVRGFLKLEDSLFVFMGLDHMGGRSGRVFRLRQDNSAWALEPFNILDGSPEAWVVDRGNIVILTGTGLWQATPDGHPRKLHDLQVGGLYPTSMVLAPDEGVYVGMRRYLLHLIPTGENWTEEWLVDADCVHARIEDYDCKCRH